MDNRLLISTIGELHVIHFSKTRQLIDMWMLLYFATNAAEHRELNSMRVNHVVQTQIVEVAMYVFYLLVRVTRAPHQAIRDDNCASLNLTNFSNYRNIVDTVFSRMVCVSFIDIISIPTCREI